MSKTNTFENDGLKLYFNATPIANLADNAAAAPAASIFVKLYTSDPTETGAAGAEAAYTGYANVAVVRSGAGWVVTANSVSPAANIEFPVCTAAPGANITHFGVCRTTGGVPDYVGTVTPNVVMAVGVVPRLTTASTITED